MNMKIVVLEPHGNQEFDLSIMIDSDRGDDECTYLVVTGVSEIPTPESGDIELLVYHARGYTELRDTEELWELQESEEHEYKPIHVNEYSEKAIEWYEQRGFTAVRVDDMDIVSPL